MKPLLLRTLPREEARLRQRIGHGLGYPFTLAGEDGELQLRLFEAGERPPVQNFACRAGRLAVTGSEALLSLFSACPLLPEPGACAEWYWPLFNQHLSPALRALFGDLTPQDAACEPADGMCLAMCVTLGEAQAQSQLRLAPATLAALLNQPGWTPLSAPLHSALPLSLPIDLGAVSFAPSQLRTLRPGDLIFPATSYFFPTGRGELRLAQWHLEGELLFGEGHPARFLITRLENSYMNVTPEENMPADTPRPDEGLTETVAPGSSPFDALPLALTVRCGHLRLTLGELNRLDVGSTVTVENVVPGEALLCHGEFPLAKGELVDVEGRLGLQITHMLPGVASVGDVNR
ncbi:aldolase [Pantoea deleyi]|uniref:Aldolase n=1 Tax=Pantoea deleyi TaxID=470932 RepID=A0A506Q7I5_9GAMM|nr:FliM/FliN family flagellar motor switch protein [Pantoea deleyi]ORM77466.1 aldolase [Pantoea deleyi]TPV42133.1 aldolase [Pantoea deleyi]